ncbi:MAG: NAD(P)/FAD-dependent oxidoreductase [Chloroflexota bacterium]|nr:MAG: FAD-dependent oxidoreductase [Chloroflexota bacterium]
MTESRQHRVIIIGAGFGGLYAARNLVKQNLDVLVIDRNNYHTFTPLLYQVATCGLEPEEIAYPVRGIFRNMPGFRFLVGEVVEINPTERWVAVQTNGHVRRELFDDLILAAGSVSNTFNNESVARYGFGLKDLSDAVRLRNHILRQFERAAWTSDPDERRALTTMVVVGGGPTGLEMAGALYELYDRVLRKEYDFLRDLKVRVVLVEAVDRLLLPFPERLQQAALEQVRDVGIEVILGNPVAEVSEREVRLKDGTTIASHTLVWAAGVKASPLAEMLAVPLKPGGRVPVHPTLEVIGHKGIYVVGDMAWLEDEKGAPYPMLIPVAKQQGILAARNILRRLRGEAQQPFHYHDRGIMATIGRSRAVAWIYNRIPLRGFVAWLAWLGLHLIALMGFRNRANVFINWVWNYLHYGAPVRLILEIPPDKQHAGREALALAGEVPDGVADEAKPVMPEAILHG